MTSQSSIELSISEREAIAACLRSEAVSLLRYADETDCEAAKPGELEPYYFQADQNMYLATKIAPTKYTRQS
jgi:hypothetical protein